MYKRRRDIVTSRNQLSDFNNNLNMASLEIMKNEHVESAPNSVADVTKGDINIADQTPVIPKSFNLLSACATGITTGNAWAVLGGGIVCETSPLPALVNRSRSHPSITAALPVLFLNCVSKANLEIYFSANVVQCCGFLLLLLHRGVHRGTGFIDSRIRRR